jgi:hypothetical protein
MEDVVMLVPCVIDIFVFMLNRTIGQALGQTVEWFRKALAVEPVKGNLRLSGYSACGQDGGVQLPHAYIEGNLPLLLGIAMGTFFLPTQRSSSIRGMGEFFSIAILREDGDSMPPCLHSLPYL